MNDCQPLLFRFAAVFLLLVAGPAAFDHAVAEGSHDALSLAVAVTAYASAAALLVGFAVRPVAAVMGALALAALVTGAWDAASPGSMLALGSTVLLVAALALTAVLGAGGLSVEEWLRERRLTRVRGTTSPASPSSSTAAWSSTKGILGGWRPGSPPLSP